MLKTDLYCAIKSEDSEVPDSGTSQLDRFRDMMDYWFVTYTPYKAVANYYDRQTNA